MNTENASTVKASTVKASNKNSSNQMLLIGIIGAGAAYYYYTKNKQESTASQPMITPPVLPPPPVQIITPAGNTNYPIVFGKFHPDAKILQKEVNATQDGIIGNNTLALLRKYLPAFPTNFQINSYQHLQAIISDIQFSRNQLYQATIGSLNEVLSSF